MNAAAPRALSATAFATLLLVALMMGANHVGVVGNSAILNVEPVFALALAWLMLDQVIAPVQIGGALLVVGAVMVLGLRKRA